MPLPSLAQLCKLSLTQPRRAATLVVTAPFNGGQAAGLALLAIILGTILASVGMWLRPPTAAIGFLRAPMPAVAVQFGFLIAIAGLVATIGRSFGGRGGMAGALKVMAWLQVMLAGFQVIQFAVLIVVPPLAGLVGLAGFCWFLWALSHFVAELHGFESAAKTGVMLFISLFAVLFVVALLMTLLGISLPQLS